MNEETKTESLLDGDFSCETTEDLYEPSDDELLYPSRHYETIGFDLGSSKGSYESVAKYSVNEDGSINF
jgi:hypothetical protein